MLNDDNHMPEDQISEDNLSGQLLIATPGMLDPNFSGAVIYICAHSEEGAMGLIINRQAEEIDFQDLLGKLFTPEVTTPISLNSNDQNLPYIHIGGPMEKGRGFVLHSSDYHSSEHTFEVNDKVSLTATLDILKAIANGDGPSNALLALGYAGWAPGQLEQELRETGWLHCPASQELIFETDIENKYQRAFETLGIDPAFLVNETGHA